MSEQRDLEEKVRRAEHAERILNDKLVKDALNSMKQTVFHNIETSHFKHVDEREDLYKMLRAINAFEEEFKQHIQGGKKAKSRLQEILNKLKR
jgi:hypothetical protein